MPTHKYTLIALAFGLAPLGCDKRDTRPDTSIGLGSSGDGENSGEDDESSDDTSNGDDGATSGNPGTSSTSTTGYPGPTTTTGTTSGTSTTGPTGTTTTTGGGCHSNGAWGDCWNGSTFDNTPCENSAALCLNEPTWVEGDPPMYSVCAQPCTEACDCPGPQDGSAVPVCLDMTGDGMLECALGCPVGTDCPTGMVCVANDYCGWPQ
jgi:hypothetical protein